MLRTTLLTLILATIAAVAQPALAQTTVDADGLVRDRAGRALYVFDGDHPSGTSTCYAGCHEAWQPFLAPVGAAVRDQHSVHTRADGRMQWGWNGKPLYYFAGDRGPGDIEGDGLGGVWHAVRTEPPGAPNALSRTEPETTPWPRS